MTGSVPDSTPEPGHEHTNNESGQSAAGSLLDSMRDSLPDSAKAKKSPLPDAGDMVFIFLVSLPLFMLPYMLFGDGSTGWHIAVGQHILSLGSIPHTDFLSSSHSGQPWVAYQWLTDLIMGILVAIGGLNLLAVACSLSIAFLFLALYDRMRRDGLSVFPSLILVVIGSLLAAMHYLARPHLANFWGVYLFSTKLEDFNAGRIDFKKLLIWLMPTMLLWTNMHPAFGLGIGITGLYILGALWDCFKKPTWETRKSFAVERIKPYLILLACLALVTLINPYGIELHQYIAAYLKRSAVITQTDEFQSPVFHGNLHSTCFELLMLGLIFGLYRAAKNISVAKLLTVLAFTHMSLQAVRNLPLFAIVSLSAIGQLLGGKLSAASVIAEGTSPNPIQKLLLRVKKMFVDFEEQEAMCKMHVVPIAFSIFLVVAAFMHGTVLGFPVLKSDFNPKTMPTHTLQYIERSNLDLAHGLNFDNWGGYLRYKIGKPVFMDDRADFFPEKFYLEYASLSRALPGYEKIFEKYHLYWVIMPSNSYLGGELAKNPDWTLVAEDQAAKLWVNDKLRAAAAPSKPR